MIAKENDIQKRFTTRTIFKVSFNDKNSVCFETILVSLLYDTGDFSYSFTLVRQLRYYTTIRKFVTRTKIRVFAAKKCEEGFDIAITRALIKINCE